MGATRALSGDAGIAVLTTRGAQDARRRAAPGTQMRANTPRDRTSPPWADSAAASTLAPVVESTLAPVVGEEPPTRRSTLQVRRIGGPKGPVEPPD